jgi:hypothetical protein
MNLILIPAHHVDYAWKDGADCLSDACMDECTIDQLKMVLSRGERQLVRMDDEGKTVGWGVYKVDQYPNARILHITSLYAPRCHFERFFDALKGIAADLGCSRVRCSAKPAQARLYAMKLGFEPVYTTLEVVI